MENVADDSMRRAEKTGKDTLTAIRTTFKVADTIFNKAKKIIEGKTVELEAKRIMLQDLKQIKSTIAALEMQLNLAKEKNIPTPKPRPRPRTHDHEER